ncbi:acetylornithine transaminase [Microbacterium halotolerans]|uniref:acetylornithine transaminase n=1 Tax=Microbacterium halotolerans TaxID=246613 RepID=UPI000E6ACCF2|nr:acetylornithine transaminase [Microbacterium halotolerans]
MSDANWKVAAERDLMSLGTRPRLLESGSGSYVTDDVGREYLDFLGGIAVNSLGHAHPVFVSAVAEQAAKLAHVSNLFASQPQLDLAARLKRLAGTGDAGRVFLANAGSEANETALKLARLHGNPRGKTAIVSLAGAFHGRSIGALSITPKAAYQDPFAPLLPDTRTIEPTLDALDQAFAADDVAAIFIEPIQGEAGVRELPEGFLARARELTRRHDALLILDEVQTGSGRTGEWFAFQLPGMLPEGELPDAVTFAKAVGAGFPLGGLITFGRASELFSPGMHNSTFGGNPLASRVADRVLAHVEDEGLLANVTRRGAQLREAVSGLPGVSGTRGAGLLIGIALERPIAADVVAHALDGGLIVNAPAPDTIRIAPAFTVGDPEIEDFIRRFGDALNAASQSSETTA